MPLKYVIIAVTISVVSLQGMEQEKSKTKSFLLACFGPKKSKQKPPLARVNSGCIRDNLAREIQELGIDYRAQALMAIQDRRPDKLRAAMAKLPSSEKRELTQLALLLRA